MIAKLLINMPPYSAGEVGKVSVRQYHIDDDLQKIPTIYSFGIDDGRETIMVSKSAIQELEEPNSKPLSIVDFSWALDMLKAGHALTRTGWNGKGQFIYYVPANQYAAVSEHAKQYFGDKVPYRAYIALKTAQEDVIPWLPSMGDLFAEDWCLYEHQHSFGPGTQEGGVSV